MIYVAIRTILTILTGLVVCSAGAEENPSPAPVEAPATEGVQPLKLRSKTDNHVWIGASISPIGIPSWGISAGGGLGTETDAQLKLQFGRCAGVVDWHVQHVYHWDPARVSNSIVGLGANCRIVSIAPSHRFWHGTHVSAQFLLQQGRSTYHLVEYAGSIQGERELAAGNAWGRGYRGGGDFNFPLWLGFWINAGVSLEYMTYSYKIPDAIGVNTNGQGNTTIGLHVGLSYAL